MLTHGSLFAGTGGFDKGFDAAGIETLWQVEIDKDCQKVLRKHWPAVQLYADVTEVKELPYVDTLPLNVNVWWDTQTIILL